MTAKETAADMIEMQNTYNANDNDQQNNARETATEENDATTKNQNKNAYSMKTAIKNKYFCARIVIILVTAFLLLLSISYAFGNLLSLKLSNYSCPKKTAGQVRQHSISNSLSKGDSEGCWRTKGFTVHEGALWSSESYSSEWNLTAQGILRSIAFFMISSILLALLFHHTQLIINDIRRYGHNGEIIPRKTPSSKTAAKISYKSNKFYKFAMLVIKTCTFEIDSKAWIIKQVAKESFEIIMQSLAILYYNGYGIIQADDDVVLAQKPQFVILFSVFISFNCILTSLLWLLYAFKPLFCHGLLFHGLLYSNDVLFDIFYALFPVIIVSQSSDEIAIGLASLQTGEQIGFWVVWIPLALLCYNSYSLSIRMRRTMSADLRISDGRMQQICEHDTPKPTMKKSEKISFSTRQLMTSYNFTKSRKSRKIFIVLVSFIFGVYGILILSLVIAHFDSSETFCKSVITETNLFAAALDENSNTTLIDEETQQIIDEHCELLLWNNCKFKVYPFDTYPCQCRQFEVRNWDNFHWTVYELKEYFAVELIDILGNILINWHMLEKMRWEATDVIYSPNDPPSLNLTGDMFNAYKMRVFKLSSTPISSIDESISNWKRLGYFDFNENDGINKLPNTFSELHNLLYVSYGGLFSITHFPIEICSLSQLVTLIIELTSITSIPHCIGKLKHLTSILLTLNDRLQNFPLNILNIDSLLELNVVSTHITWNRLIEYNNITVTEFDEQFKWNKKASFWFQLSDFCDEISNIPSVKFKQWIYETNCCQGQCDIGNLLVGVVICTAYEWDNGVCDNSCNNQYCLHDGGDCAQLCDWNECDISLLGNGNCDQGCNNENCNFDQYDCLTPSVDYSECALGYALGEHGCNASWIGDGYCDSNCQMSLCGFDEHDCDDCENNECSNAYAIFDIGANQITNDEHIDENEICPMWGIGLASGLFDDLIIKQPELMNCTKVIPAFDRNNDNKLNFHEMIIGLHDLFYIANDTAMQIDCSVCVGGMEQYIN